MNYTICVLLYGDYPDLALRCLKPLLPFIGKVDLRIGMNAVGERTKSMVGELLDLYADKIHVHESSENILKYPMMRRLLYDPTWPKLQDYVMWFDDDSCITSKIPMNWFWCLDADIERADMLGSLYSICLTGNQHLWIRDQPWFNHKPVEKNQKVTFATGGWWVIRSSILKKFNWPVPELRHRGGDVMLGELCRQHHLRLENRHYEVAINADDKLRDSKSPRRGFDSKPIGSDYDPGPAALLVLDNVPEPVRPRINLDL